MTPQSYNDQEFDQLLDTLVQRSGLWTPPCRPALRPECIPPSMLDDFHRAIVLDDPTATAQARTFVVKIERLLRSTAPEVKREAIAAMVAVLARGYNCGHGEAPPTMTFDPATIGRIRDSLLNIARKYFGPRQPDR